MSEDAPHIRIRPDGPYLVTHTPLRKLGIERDDAKRPVAWEHRGDIEHQETYALCRCGASLAKPFCDGTHKRIGFDGSEAADREPTAARQTAYAGPELVLEDDKTLCWHAGFCVREHAKAWDLVASAGSEQERALLVDMVANCPSGRLELHAQDSSEPIEPNLPPRIGVVADGPLYVEGGVPVQGADGEVYEVRNRVSLCRCGASRNKPFCDNSHVAAGFRDAPE